METVPTPTQTPAQSGRGLVGRLLAAAESRFRRARSGSVIILVVALLVLLALLGTAFITTTGSDRDSAVQNQYNTQIEILLQSIKDLTVLQIVNKVAVVDAPPPAPAPGGVPSYRSAVPLTPNPALTLFQTAPFPTATAVPFPPPPQYVNMVDYAPYDMYLADRIPVPSIPNPPNQSLSGVWTYISASPLASVRDALYPALLSDQFSSPLVDQGKNFVPSGSSRFGMKPDSVTITSADGVSRIYPALQMLDSVYLQGHPLPKEQSRYGKYVLAADTDGDGIADAGLFELPIGQVNGVRYYGAVRIIDNNSAVNAATAWENYQQRFAEDNRLPANVTPANVDFRGLVEGWNLSGATNIGPDVDPDNNATTLNAPFNAYNLWRFNRPLPIGTEENPHLELVRDGSYLYNGTIYPPLDSQFATRYDALWTQLGSRLGNPGINGTEDGTNTKPPGRSFRALGMSESVALARHGGLADPNGSLTVLEQYLPRSYRGASVTRLPWSPDKWKDWFNLTYDYDYLDNLTPLPISTPLRALTVAWNPVTNYVPAFLSPTLVSDAERAGQYRYRGVFNAASSYTPGDWIRWANPALPPANNLQAYVCFAPVVGVDPTTTTAGQAVWASAPWVTHPTKVNVNTASFGVLAAAYGAVMGDGGPQSVTPVTPNDPDRQKPLNVSPALLPGSPDPAYTGSAGGVAWQPGVFMDVSRRAFGVTGTNAADRLALTPSMMRQLRSAIAAVNTIDIRDADDDVTSRTITLMDGTNVVRTQVYGTERQPFITEAVVNISDTNQIWVCIELYNPYPVPINLAGYRLAYRSRDATQRETAAGARAGQPLITLIDTLATLGTIPANGYAYIENATASRPLDMVADAAMTARMSAGGHLLQAAALADVIGGGGTRELLLLHTRRADGQLTRSFDPLALANTHPANDFNEGTGGQVTPPPYVAPVAPERLIDFVPADQLECAGMVTGQNIVDVPPPPGAPAGTPNVQVPISERWHYRRANEAQTAGNYVNRFHCVYGGPYSYEAGNNVDSTASRRQRGWIRDKRPYAADPAQPAVLTPQLTLPALGLDKQRFVSNAGAFNEHNMASGSGNTLTPQQATFRTRSIQVNNVGFGGPWKPISGQNAAVYAPPPDANGRGYPMMPAPDNRAVPAFPFGGFPRIGDIMQVPFIGAYRIEYREGEEINAISMDAAFAEDGDLRDDDEANGSGAGNPVEQLGRFCPIRDPAQPIVPIAVLGEGADTATFNDYEGRANTNPSLNPKHRYAWATDLFDYLTVLSPQDDYQPDVEASAYYDDERTMSLISGDPTVFRSYPKWPQQPPLWPTDRHDQERDPANANLPMYGFPQGTPNGPKIRSPSAANFGREETTGVQGLINLNTAHWKVIATLPFTDDRITNAKIAKSIVFYREKVGPFRNLFDLQNIRVGYTLPYNAGAPTTPPFFNALTQVGRAAVKDLEPVVADGDLSPLPVSLVGGLAVDGVYGDFEARYLMLNRISNLVCFRSDSFTVYVTVQGWRNAGSKAPEMVVQRRAAFIVDRSTVRPDLSTLSTTGVKVTDPVITNVPQE